MLRRRTCAHIWESTRGFGRRCARSRRSVRTPRVPRLGGVLRPENWTRPAGVSPVRVIAGEPGSRPRFVVERRRAERGVESLFGGSKRAGRSATRRESCSLVTVTTGEPSRSCHGEGSIRPYWRSGHALGRVPPGYGERHVRTVWFGTGEARLRSLVSKDRSYKPMVKSSGAQRESDGVVVPVIAGSNPAGGKGPDFGHAGGGGKREGMAGTARPNYPERACSPSTKCDNSRTGYGLRPSSPRVGVSMPCMTASTGVTSCGRRGSGSEPIVAPPGSIG